MKLFSWSIVIAFVICLTVFGLGIVLADVALSYLGMDASGDWPLY